jgi:hypothetical protein
MVAASAALFVYLSSLVKEPPKMFFADGTVFDAVLSVNYCAILIGCL